MKRNAQMSSDVLISGALGVAAIAVGLASLAATAKRMQEHGERHEALMADMDAEHQLRMQRIQAESARQQADLDKEVEAFNARVEKVVVSTQHTIDKLRAEDAEIVG